MLIAMVPAIINTTDILLFKDQKVLKQPDRRILFRFRVLPSVLRRLPLYLPDMAGHSPLHTVPDKSCNTAPFSYQLLVGAAFYDSSASRSGISIRMADGENPVGDDLGTLCPSVSSSSAPTIHTLSPYRVPTWSHPEDQAAFSLRSPWRPDSLLLAARREVQHPALNHGTVLFLPDSQ